MTKEGLFLLKKGIIKVTIILFWAVLSAFLYRQGFITTNTANIREMLGNQTAVMVLLFVLLSVTRVLFFIPGVVYMVFGGMCFGTLTGFSLSLFSIAVSESVIFIIAHCMGGDWLHRYLYKNHKDLINLTDKYGYEFLALGILCPIAPSDIICLIASMLKFKYKNYILTVVLANIPMMLVYSYLGHIRFSFESSNIVFYVIITAVLILTLAAWLKIKK